MLSSSGNNAPCGFQLINTTNKTRLWEEFLAPNTEFTALIEEFPGKFRARPNELFNETRVKKTRTCLQKKGANKSNAWKPCATTALLLNLNAFRSVQYANDLMSF